MSTLINSITFHLVYWDIWFGRNKQAFHDASIDWNFTCSHIEALYNFIPEEDLPHCTWHIVLEVIDKSFPWDFFNGYAQKIVAVVALFYSYQRSISIN